MVLMIKFVYTLLKRVRQKVKQKDIWYFPLSSLPKYTHMHTHTKQANKTKILRNSHEQAKSRTFGYMAEMRSLFVLFSRPETWQFTRPLPEGRLSSHRQLCKHFWIKGKVCRQSERFLKSDSMGSPNSMHNVVRVDLYLYVSVSSPVWR